MTRIFLVFGVALLLFSACVPNKKYVYLQKDDVHKKDIKTDTVLRSYNLKLYDYRIQPQDILYINVESLTEEEYDFFKKLNTSGGVGANILNTSVSGFLVDNQGNIELPAVGSVQMSGLSVFEAQEKLKAIFMPYLKSPIVRVRLLNFRFTVLGEVNGEKQVVSSNTRVSMLEAISLAGGLSELADRSKIKVIRQSGDSTNVFYVNLLQEDFLEAQHYYVQQNDVIVVPPLRQRPFRKYFGPNTALLVSTITTVLFLYSLINNN